jgi:hypothetical protein
MHHLQVPLLNNFFMMQQMTINDEADSVHRDALIACCTFGIELIVIEGLQHEIG